VGLRPKLTHCQRAHGHNRPASGERPHRGHQRPRAR
jgi:hypothetical protein